MEELEERLKKIEAEKKLAFDNLFYAIREGMPPDKIQRIGDYHRTLADEYGALYKEYNNKRLEKRRKEKR